jgi:hypothetical protein
MVQTTNTQPQACARVDIATDSDCAVWVEVSGSVNSISGTSQSKMVGDEYTLEGTYAIAQAGKIEPVDLTVRMAFTNVATEAYRKARDAFMTGSCDGRLCLRWIPGEDVGNDGFQTGYSIVTAFEWPPVDASTAGPIFVSFTLHVVQIDPFVFVS